MLALFARLLGRSLERLPAVDKPLHILAGPTQAVKELLVWLFLGELVFQILQCQVCSTPSIIEVWVISTRYARRWCIARRTIAGTTPWAGRAVSRLAARLSALALRVGTAVRLTTALLLVSTLALARLLPLVLSLLTTLRLACFILLAALRLLWSLLRAVACLAVGIAVALAWAGLLTRLLLAAGLGTALLPPSLFLAARLADLAAGAVLAGAGGIAIPAAFGCGSLSLLIGLAPAIV